MIVLIGSIPLKPRHTYTLILIGLVLQVIAVILLATNVHF